MPERKLSLKEKQIYIKDFMEGLYIMTAGLNRRVPDAEEILTEALERFPDQFAELGLELLKARKVLDAEM